jgi:putative transposase
MGIWTRQRDGQDVIGVTEHSDKGVRYVAERYTQCLAQAAAVASVGSSGDSYDNTLAEAFNSLLKAQLVRNRAPWRNFRDHEVAVTEYTDWFNHRRLHGEIGLVRQPSSGTTTTRTAPPRPPSARQFRASTDADTS